MKNRFETLQEAGIFPPNVRGRSDLSAECVQLLDAMTEDEVQAIISVVAKISNPAARDRFHDFVVVAGA